MAFYTYDEEADALYVLFQSEKDASVRRTIELGERLHADVDADGALVGIELLYPSVGAIDLSPIKERFGLDLRLPFNFAA